MPAGLIIKNKDTVKVGYDYADIEWWTSYNATSRVIYCETSKNCSLDFSNTTTDSTFNLFLYGYKYTTNELHTPANSEGVKYRKITITELQENTTYSYRCVSHASPPTISRTHTFTTLALANDGDDEEELKEKEEKEGEVKGEEDKKDEEKNDEEKEDESEVKAFGGFGIWMWLVAIAIIGITAYSFSSIAKRKKKE
ncbi:MAG: fibronectin type III domain-containing protein [Patescibacteria group bacterium]|nr:fibronectin type III domain-containing protein [Patescibacteria group bacterium]